MKNESDTRQLVARILGGNTDDFQTIIEDYQKLVGHIVFKMVSETADREDICQEVFVKVYQKLSSFKHESKLSTWIATIAYNTCLNHLDKRKLRQRDDLDSDDDPLSNLPSDDMGPQENAELRDVSRRLLGEIDRLPMQYRTILSLYHMDEMSYREISSITKLPEGTVKSHLFRARKLLKDRLMAKYSMEDLCR